MDDSMDDSKQKEKEKKRYLEKYTFNGLCFTVGEFTKFYEKPGHTDHYFLKLLRNRFVEFHNRLFSAKNGKYGPEIKDFINNCGIDGMYIPDAFFTLDQFATKFDKLHPYYHQLRDLVIYLYYFVRVEGEFDDQFEDFYHAIEPITVDGITHYRYKSKKF